MKKISTGNIEFNFCSINQICGQNMIKKNQVFSNISRYFSSEKIAEEEITGIEVKIDNEAVGRKYMNCFLIDNREKLFDSIKLTKNSLLTRYIINKLTGLSFQIELMKIEAVLDGIYSELNKAISDDISGLLLDYGMNDILDIIQKSNVLFGGEEEQEEHLPGNVDLLKIWLKLLINYVKQEPEKIIVLIPNIDHLLNKTEYAEIVDFILSTTEDYDISFIIGISLDGYVRMNDTLFSGVCVINDDCFQFEDINMMLDFVEKYYPFCKQWDKKDIYEMLPAIIQKVGAHRVISEIQSDVILKMINHSLMINECRQINENPAEISFLHEPFML